jgi:hypothetical protein
MIVFGKCTWRRGPIFVFGLSKYSVRVSVTLPSVLQSSFFDTGEDGDYRKVCCMVDGSRRLRREDLQAHVLVVGVFITDQKHSAYNDDRTIPTSLES